MSSSTWVGGSDAVAHPGPAGDSAMTCRATTPDWSSVCGRCATERLSSAAIAERLNAEGFRPPKRTNRFSGEMVLRLTSQSGAGPAGAAWQPGGSGP